MKRINKRGKHCKPTKRTTFIPIDIWQKYGLFMQLFLYRFNASYKTPFQLSNFILHSTLTRIFKICDSQGKNVFAKLAKMPFVSTPAPLTFAYTCRALCLCIVRGIDEAIVTLHALVAHGLTLGAGVSPGGAGLRGWAGRRAVVTRGTDGSYASMHGRGRAWAADGRVVL